MPAPREDLKAAYHINQLKHEKMKTHAVRDGSQRVTVLYEALAHVQHGEPCLATIYRYETANLVPTDTCEKEAIWDSAWDFDLPVNGD